ncbi:MAG TPA: hypothetical protein VLV48_02700 [Thermoanaerobaculia bacterium]|nr:hypothetical protein [Thermoanaerobaculia bacterium]
MRPGEEVNDRDLRGVEARLIGGTVSVSARRDVEAERRGDRLDRAAPFDCGLGAERGELPVAEVADHVEVDHPDDALERVREVLHHVRGAGEADLLPREEREDDGAPAGRVREKLGCALRGEKDRGDAGRVVVRPVVDRLLVRTHGAVAADAQMVVVRADDDDFAGERAASREDSRDILRIRPRRLERDVSFDAHLLDDLRARLQIAVHVLLKRIEVDPGGREPPLRDARLHLDHRNARGALRSVVAKDGDLVVSFVLHRSGDEDDGGGAALARLMDLVARRGPAARLPSIERRRVVALLRLVAEHQDDLPLQVEAVELLIADRRRFDAVAGEDELPLERAGAGEPERCPVVESPPCAVGAATTRTDHGRGAGERVPVEQRNARLDAERLAIARAEPGAKAGLAKARLDPGRGARDAGGADPPPLHRIVRQGPDPGSIGRRIGPGGLLGDRGRRGEKEYDKKRNGERFFHDLQPIPLS